MVDYSDEFDTINYRVVRILKDHPDARDSDDVLCEYFLGKKLPMKLALIKSIVRCRRHIQRHNPLLKSNEQVQMLRNKKEQEYQEKFGKSMAEIYNE